MKNEPGRIVLATLTIAAISTQYAHSENRWYQTMPENEFVEIIPDWAAEELKDEADPMESVVVNFNDKHTLEVSGELVAEPQWSDNSESWYFEVKYNGQTGFECHLFDNREDPLDTLTMLQDYVTEWYLPENSQGQGSIDVNSGLHLQSSKPVYGIDRLKVFTHEQDGAEQTVITLSQGRVSYLGKSILGCISVDFGYQKTIDRIFNTMVDTWVSNAYDSNKPYYRHISVLKLGGNGAGFLDISLLKDADGDTMSRYVMSMGIPTEPYVYSYSDKLDIEYSTPSGATINKYSSTITNGELIQSLALNYAENEEWLAEGEMNGKAVEFKISEEQAPLSVLGQLQVSKELISDKSRKESTVNIWVPDADPSVFIPVSFQINDRATDNNIFQYSMGPIEVESIVMDSGTFKSMTMNVGGIAMDVETILEQGEIE